MTEASRAIIELFGYSILSIVLLILAIACILLMAHVIKADFMENIIKVIFCLLLFAMDLLCIGCAVSLFIDNVLKL